MSWQTNVLITSRFVSAQQEQVLNRFNLVKSKYVLAVGRFVPEKGFGDLVDAFERIKLKSSVLTKDWKLVLVGDADHTDEYSRSLKEKCAHVPNVVLTGFQNSHVLRELYSHAGHFVLPSFHEGLPIVLLEALSYGSSCLVSDIPANREVGLGEDRYFQAGNIEQISQKIMDFIDRPATEFQRQRRMEYIKSKYNWDKIALKTLNVYHQVEDHRGFFVVNHEERPAFSFGLVRTEQALV